MNGIHEVVGSIPTRSTNCARSTGLAVLLLVALLAGCTTTWPGPRAVAGTIDLTTWNPVLDGPVRLDGEWTFYWKRLVDPNDTRALDVTETFTPVPGSWPGPAGFATYRLRVLLPPGASRLALRLLTVSTAYRLYVDGDLIAERGQVAEDAASGKPDYDPVIVDLTARARETLDLVLQASNFHYAKGGAWEPIWLGNPARIRRLREYNVALTLFLVGGFAIIGLYHLSRFWAEHERRGATLSLLLCDVDHFKHYNDTHGHVQGDDTLRAVAGVLSQTANRPGDTVARYGGDEMVLLLPDTDDGGAREVGERVLRQVAELAIPHDVSKTRPIVTVSVGVATLVRDRRKAQERLIELADAGLYEAKKRGRNCLGVA